MMNKFTQISEDIVSKNKGREPFIKSLYLGLTFSILLDDLKYRLYRFVTLASFPMLAMKSS